MIKSLKQLQAKMEELGHWGLKNTGHPQIKNITDEMKLCTVYMKQLHKHTIDDMIAQMLSNLPHGVTREFIVKVIKGSDQKEWWDWEHGTMLCNEDIEVIKKIELSLEFIESLKIKSK